MPDVELPDFIRQLPRGSLVLAAPGTVAMLVLREDDWNLRHYPPYRCPLEVRLETWDADNGVVLAMVLLRLLRNDAFTFECQIDLGSPPGVRLVQCLAGQARLDVHLVTDVVARSFRTENPLQADAVFLIDRVRSLKGWSPEEHAQAVARFNALYPTASKVQRCSISITGFPSFSAERKSPLAS